MAEDADYDYPVGNARPLFSWMSEKPLSTQQQLTPLLIPKSKIVTEKHYHSLDRRLSNHPSYQASLSPLSTYSLFTQLNLDENQFQKLSSNFDDSGDGPNGSFDKITLTKNMGTNKNILDQVPSAPKFSSNNSSSPGNIYYSSPKNIPVNRELTKSFYFNQPIFQTNTSQNCIQNFPRQLHPQQQNSRPAIPPKSTAVLNRIQNPGIVISSGSRIIQKFPTLDRANTAKALPALPVKRSNSSCSATKTPPISPNYSYPPSNPRPVIISNSNLSNEAATCSSGSTIFSFSTQVSNQSNEKPTISSSKVKIQDEPKFVQLRAAPLKQPMMVSTNNPNAFSNNRDDDNDDDENDEDYAYDYVCLESKKKLDAEDEDIKNILHINIQKKYEELALDSCDDKAKQGLESLEKTFKNLNLKNRQMTTHFLSSYRRFFEIAARHFISWNCLTLQLIRSPHPANVCINFTKHILLSGQNILLIVKSFQRHCFETNKNDEFMEEFIEALRKIVIQTKRFAGEFPSSNLRKDLERAIDDVKGMINRFQLNF